MKIEQLPLSKGNFIDEVVKKSTIVLHHTAGAKNAEGTINGWNLDNRGAMGTAYVIDYTGVVFQCFDDSKWAYALGVKTSNFRQLERQAVQIELCAWGGLVKTKSEYYNAYGGVVPASEVETLDVAFRGYKYYHKYSSKQIESLQTLVTRICKKHGISGSYSRTDFNVSKNALKGASGFWTHNSYRADKNDIYPDINLIDTFKKDWLK